MARAEFSMRIAGFRELDRLLAQLPKAVGFQVRYRALLKASKVFLAEARANAPVDEGDLKKSIGAARMRRRTYGAEVAAGASAPHAHLVESGTRERVVKSTGRKVGSTKPTRFLTRAWDSTKDEVLEEFSHELGSELVKAAEKLARKASQAKLTRAELAVL